MLGCAVAVAILVLVPLIGLVLFASAVDSDTEPTPQPTTGRPTQSVEPEPSQDPTVIPTPEATPTAFELPVRDFGALPAPHSDDPAWVSVQRSFLYDASFPAQTGCPPPAYVETMPDLEVYTAEQLACIQAAWKPVLQGLGAPSHDVPHYFYAGETVESPCGTSTAPAFYCSADGGAIYFGEPLLLGTAYDPLWGKDLVGHEYGHHLQALAGFFDVLYDLPEGNETIRRSELQATCFAWGGIRNDDSYTLDQEFYDQIEPHLRSFLDDGIHGSEDSLAYWGLRGFHLGTLGDGCNTWVVGSEWVR